MRSLILQRDIVCDSGLEELSRAPPIDEGSRNFDELVTITVLKRTGGRGKQAEMHNACCTEKWKVPSSVIEPIKIAASLASAQNETANFA